MPTSRTGKVYYTDEQYQVARHQSSALAYAKAAGYDLIKDGNCYHLREHDSMIFTTDGRWFWNSHRLQGGALEFITQYEGRSLPEAVNLLAGSSEHFAAPAPGPKNEVQKPFELPERSGSFRRLFAYLCGARGLSNQIVQTLVRDKRLYEGVRDYTNPATGEVKQAHNAVFLGLDAQGQPRSGFQRGLSTYVWKSFKRDLAGSAKEYAFCLPGRVGVTEVAVFEAAIDAISHATLVRMEGKDYEQTDRIALGGVGELPLLHYLQEHPAVTDISLCLDKDEPGIAATLRIREALIACGYTAELGYRVVSEAPPDGKDWNEYLLQSKERLAKEHAEDVAAFEPQEEEDELEP